ncbi:Nuf2 family-domain-containing protein [Phakopsora pachyrhizi]|uniref:Nuf2 family-domain-containing protein n=1 Tax=Phakopsora pachyrhizi TaxID=170000 RepID=A0AAV0BFJ1_PHAPC|nr:Nuf2 family-domain-containing protein [Phakopsora pachyrhizi]CAH7685309.1 Nuf2 family-domain-containing protein [Phakopsora pachyrhizi]
MSFPIYAPGEIIDAIRNFGYQGDLTAEDIAKPTPQKMSNLYEWLLNYLTGITREDIRNAARQTLMSLHNPHVYEYRVIAGTFKDALDQVMRCAAIYDFSDRDMTSPTPERVRRLLSGVVNFFLFESEQAQQILHPLEEGLEQLQTQRVQLLEREAEFVERISAVRQQQEDEERAAAELIPQVEAFKAAILECKDIEGPLDQRRAELHESRKTIAEQNRAAVAELQRIEAEISRLLTRVARSPEKVRSAIDSLQKTLASEMASITSLEQNSRLLEQKIRALDKYEKDLHVCIKLADEWESEMGRGDEVRKNLGTFSDELETRSAELQEVEKKTTQAQRRTELLQDQLERAHSGIVRKRKAGKERHSKATERHESAIQAQGEYEKEWNQLTNHKALLGSQVEGLCEDYIRAMKQGQVVYSTLRSELLNYTMKHQAAINAVEAKLPLPVDET